MKLKSYNIENSRNGFSGKMTIRLHRSGLISFSKAATEELKLQKGDKLEFFQDEESPKDWYVTKSENGIPTREKEYKKSGMACINSASIVKAIFEAVGINEKSCAFKIAKEPQNYSGMKLWPILTAAKQMAQSAAKPESKTLRAEDLKFQ